MSKSKQTEFYQELEALLNRYSKENESNTPDFILASYLTGCLEVYARTAKERDKWYNFEPFGAPATERDTTHDGAK